MATKNTKTPATKNPQEDISKVISQIIQLGTDRSYKDVGDWQAALTSAEWPDNPRRQRLINLYEQLKLDGHFRMIRKQLIMHLTSGMLQIANTSTNEVDKDITKVFGKRWFNKLCIAFIDAIFEGHSLLQLKEVNPTTGSINLELIPRKNVVPEIGGWLRSEWDQNTSAVLYRNDPEAMKWLIEFGEPKDLGELNPCAPYILFKKNALQCWSEFCEKFGMPLAKAKVNARDLKAVNRMENFLVKMGSSSYAIIDQGEEIDFVESVKSDSFNVFDKLIERCNSEMSKMVLLQVMANDVGANGSRAQAEVHGDRSKEVRDSLRTQMVSFVNEILLPQLAFHGFQTDNLEASYFEVTAVDKDTFEQDKWLEENFDIPIEHWKKKYNTPLQGRKSAQATDSNNLSDGLDQQIKNFIKLFFKGPISQQVNMHARIAELYQSHNHD